MDEGDRKRIQKIIEQIAAQEGVSVDAMQREMQAAIDDAFSKRHEPGHEAFISIFGNRCPSVEEFIFCNREVALNAYRGIQC